MPSAPSSRPLPAARSVTGIVLDGAVSVAHGQGDLLPGALRR